MSIWERFDDIEGATASAVEEAGAKYDPIPEGEYKFRIESLESTESQQGMPMAKGQFRITGGEFNNRVVFYNQIIVNANYPEMTAGNISKIKAFIGGVLGEDYEFTTLGKLGADFEAIPIGTEFTGVVSYGRKDVEKKYTQIRVIKKVAEEVVAEDVGSMDLPFDL